MKIAVAGKGGAGKTTVAGTVARALARHGRSVLALDADANPMLGISLGLGAEATERLLGVRQGLDAGEVAHEPTVEGLVETFGADAPDGVRLVVASRIDRPDPGCPCCGVSPEQLLGDLEANGRLVVCDLEAGVGTVVRAGRADVVLVVAEPTAKSIEVARRAVDTASKTAEVVVVANRLRDDSDEEAIRAALRDSEIVAVPEDPAIQGADRDGLAPIDAAPDSPGVRALLALASRLYTAPARAL